MSVAVEPPEADTRGDRKRHFGSLAALYRNPLVAAILFTWLFATALFVYLGSVPPEDMEVEVSVSYSADACCRLGVSVNEHPMRFFDMVPGAVGIHRVHLTDSGISRVRFDLGDVPRSHVVFRKLTVRSRVGVHLIPLSTIHSSYREGVAPAQGVEDGVLFRVEMPGGDVFQDYAIPASPNPLAQWFWSSQLQIMTSTISFVVLGIVAVALGGFRWDRETLLLVITGALTLLVIRSLPSVLAEIHLRDSAAQAVGLSSYLGQWKQNERLVHFVVWLTALAIPVVIGGLVHVLKRKGRHDDELDLDLEQRSSLRILHVALAALIAFMLLVPDLGSALELHRNYVYPRGWDVGNIIHWDWLVSKGSLPVRDFFYPYGSQYVFASDLPWGSLLWLASDLLAWLYVLMGTFLVLRRFTKNPVGRFWTVFVLIFLLIASQGVVRFSCIDQAIPWLCPRPERYLGGLGLVLLFAAVRREANWHPLRLVVVLAAFHTLLLEPVQFIYAAPGILLLVMTRVWDTRGLRGAMARLFFDGMPLLFSSLMYVGVLLATGQLTGFLDFYGALGALTTYASLPVPIEDWLRSPSDLPGWLYWSPISAVVLGLVSASVARRAGREPYFLVVAVGTVGFMILGKQLTRPGGESAWWIPLVFGPTLWIAIAGRFSRPSHRVACGVLIGFLASYLLVTGALTDISRRLADSPRRLLVTMKTIAFDRDLIDEVNASRFDDSRFRNYDKYFAVSDELERLGAIKDEVWVASDDPILDVLISDGKEPFYFATSYDASPLRWQIRFVAELEKRKPAYAIWNSRGEFIEGVPIDGVPYNVRVPLIYSWMVKNYVPISSAGGEYEILRKRNRDEGPAVSWWAEKMGPAVHVGSLMAIATLPVGSCSGADCASYLQIKFPPGVEMPRDLNVHFTVAGTKLILRGWTAPHVRTYTWNLDRLWFWSAGEGYARTVDTTELEGASVSVLELRPDRNVLY